jgi:hypothetical protein
MKSISASPQNRSTLPRQAESGIFTQKNAYIALGVASITLLALAHANAPKDVTPEGPSKSIDAVVESHDTQAMQELGIKQLEGSAIVALGSNVRTSPTVNNNEGFENTSDTFTRYAAASDKVLILDNPYVTVDPSNETNGSWYGAVDPETNEVYWVNEVATAKVNGTVTEPNDALKSHIYAMPSPELNK